MIPTLMQRIPKHKSFETKLNDFDETKGIVRAYISAFNNKDLVGDIVLPTAFNKTIKERFDKIQHYLNHGQFNGRKSVGVISELKPDEYGLLMTSQLLTKDPDGNFVYEFYKANAELGKSVYHSIGYIVDKEYYDKQNEINYLQELMLKEGSTLTVDPANDKAIMVGVKSLEEFDIDYLISQFDIFEKMLNSKLNDVQLNDLETLKNRIQSEIDSRKQPEESTVKDTTINELHTEIITMLNLQNC